MSTNGAPPVRNVEVIDDDNNNNNDDDDTASATSDGILQDVFARPPKREFKDVDVWADEPDDQREKWLKSRAPKRARKATKKASKRKRGNDESLKVASDTGLQGLIKGTGGADAEDDADEARVPEHIRELRARFAENRDTLGFAGLKVPPNYEDLYFSDDERDPRELEERPRLEHVDPCRPYDDITMHDSAGLIPASIAQYLRNYQVEGVRFLHHKFVYQMGAILGDDMGLGKTIQVAAFLTAAFGKTGDERDAKRLRRIRKDESRWYPRVLIVCPAAVIPNWQTELKRWGWWRIAVYHLSEKEDALRAARAGATEIMITTYGTYTTNADLINSVEWDAVVADECHLIKDRRAAVTQAMNNVNCLCRIGLTGTAIQNKYEEFWTLLNWTNPGHFGSLREWNQSIVRPLTRGQSHDATLHQLSVARKTAKKLVHNLLPGFFLRRMKTLIAHQLPKKTDRVIFCPLTDLQKDAYQKLLESEEIQAIYSAVDECSCGSAKKLGWCCGKVTEDGRSWIALVFPCIMALQKLSNHLTLLIPSDQEQDHGKRKRALKLLRQCAPKHWKTLYEERHSVKTLMNPEFCGKWKILKELLSLWHKKGDKVLIFSHSVRLLHILNSLFKSTSYTVNYLDGSMSGDDRQREVDDFQSDPSKFVFLISTKAGGVGLNITAANKVVIVDPHWNPAYDLQAQDRAYRFGQRQDVEVYRLISAGTIEEIVYARQIYKQQQANIGYNASSERRYFRGVQQDKDRKGELFGLKNLFTFHNDEVLLQGILNQTNIAETKFEIKMGDIEVEKTGVEEDVKAIKTEDGEDDGGGWRQFAEVVKAEDEEGPKKTKSSKPKKDPVQAILADAGVQYTHENSEVIGSSKVEAQLSRRAELADDRDLDDPEGASALFGEAEDALAGAGSSSAFAPMFNPPEDVKLRQFCSMAQELGFENATDFALVVEHMTQQDRRDALDTFYKKRMMKLLEQELKKDEADEEKVAFLKAEVDEAEAVKGIEAKPVPKTEDVSDLEGLKREGSTKMEQIKTEVKQEPVMKQENNVAAESGTVDGVRLISSIFIDDGEDEL